MPLNFADALLVRIYLVLGILFFAFAIGPTLRSILHL
jgi:hypothetical protein